ncbi:hypothetical protein KDX01_20175 [Burkholderia vietnamiensis]|uniref:hypothetical protein n=1 Tax=Burkholderia vietnamiensis TaxID=60552 RepID=UPI001B9DD60B|nr:hypothetical protein [Burkholderia vietnamiensis]MBR7975409.1 hypothetical protein [Burkholderia vietnamiensis]
MTLAQLEALHTQQLEILSTLGLQNSIVTVSQMMDTWLEIQRLRADPIYRPRRKQ